jgi:hypothetical protein
MSTNHQPGTLQESTTYVVQATTDSGVWFDHYECGSRDELEEILGNCKRWFPYYQFRAVIRHSTLEILDL